jgi:hypothetical protein
MKSQNPNSTPALRRRRKDTRKLQERRPKAAKRYTQTTGTPPEGGEKVHANYRNAARRRRKDTRKPQERRPKAAVKMTDVNK